MTKIRESRSLKITLALFVLIFIIGCIASVKRLYDPTCKIDNPYYSENNVITLVNFMPIYCPLPSSLLKPSFMLSITRKYGWDHHFCLGKVEIQTMFINDGYGCGEFGGLIVIGPSIQVFIKGNAP
jgi:hypothetical protein